MGVHDKAGPKTVAVDDRAPRERSGTVTTGRLSVSYTRTTSTLGRYGDQETSATRHKTSALALFISHFFWK